MPNILDPEFRAQFSMNEAAKEVLLDLRGHRFPCLGEFKSRCADYRQSCQTGFIVQDGDYTFVNPDKTAAIAYLSLTTHLYGYCRPSGEIENTDQSFVRLVAHPRDPMSLRQQTESTPAILTFAEALLKQAPNVEFSKDRGDSYRIISGGNGYHRAFVEQHIGAACYSPIGAVIFRAKNVGATSTQGFEKFFDAPMLSSNPDIRQGFKDMLFRLARSEFLPVSAPAALGHTPAP